MVTTVYRYFLLDVLSFLYFFLELPPLVANTTIKIIEGLNIEFHALILESAAGPPSLLISIPHSGVRSKLLLLNRSLSLNLPLPPLGNHVIFKNQ